MLRKLKSVFAYSKIERVADQIQNHWSKFDNDSYIVNICNVSFGNNSYIVFFLQRNRTE